MRTRRTYNFKRKPRAKQLEVLNACLEEPFWGLYLDMSCGKTKVTIDNICYLAEQEKIGAALIFAPKAIRHQWANDSVKPMYEENEWDKDAWDSVREDTRVYVWGLHAPRVEAKIQDAFTRPNPKNFLLVVMNTEAMSTAKGINWANRFVKTHRAAGVFLAVDEANFIKNYKSKRSRAIAQLGLASKYRRALTGTPVKNNPLDVFGVATFLSTSIYGKSWFNFRARYAKLETQFIHNRSFKVVAGFQRQEELSHKLLEYGSRVEKYECVDLPPKIYTHYNLELGPEQRRIYEAMRDDSVAMLDEENMVTASIVLVQLNKLRQILCGFTKDDNGNIHWIKDNQRFNVALDIIDELPGKALIFAPYREVVTEMARLLREKYGPNSTATYMGGTKDKAHVQMMFNTPGNGMDYLVMTQPSGKYGLSVRAGYVLYLGNEYDLDARLQSEDRSYGQGRGIEGQSTTYIDLTVEKTLDGKLTKMLVSKKRIADAITGDKWRAFMTDRKN